MEINPIEIGIAANLAETPIPSFDDCLKNKKIQKTIKIMTNKYRKGFNSTQEARQEALIVLWEVLPRYNPQKKCSVESFFQSCLRNKFNSAWRKKLYGQEQKMKQLSNGSGILDRPHCIYNKDVLDGFPCLRETEKDLLFSYFYENRNLKELGVAFGVTFQGAALRIKKAISKIRRHELQNYKQSTNNLQTHFK